MSFNFIQLDVFFSLIFFLIFSDTFSFKINIFNFNILILNRILNPLIFVLLFLIPYFVIYAGRWNNIQSRYYFEDFADGEDIIINGDDGIFPKRWSGRPSRAVMEGTPSHSSETQSVNKSQKHRIRLKYINFLKSSWAE